MCLIVLARNRHPRYPLVVVANRDEFHRRRAEQLHWWPGDDLLAGRDCQAGGTWMATDRRGRWAAVTNYRDGVPEVAPRSRGEIPLGYLRGAESPRDYLAALAVRGGEYGGFCAFAGSADALFFYSNRGEQIEEVPAGTHTLSNHLLNTPWPKSELARVNLNRLLKRERLEVEELFAVLADHQPFEDHQLPSTGVSPEFERVLSPPFIVGEEYGTRCTTVLLVDSNGCCCVAEQSFRPGGIRGKLALFEFDI